MMRIGVGFDSHPLATGRRLIIGGVEIPFDKGLTGHSDADVLSHAIADALLGAVGEGDLGTYFPDTDSTYEGISSQKILRKVLGILLEKRHRIVNIDSTLFAERPKLAPHVEEMRQALSSALDIPTTSISVKATTMEKMGFVGREEGIAAVAVALLEDMA